MKVKVKTAVWYQGKLHEVGAELTPTRDVGESWILRGIADAVDEPDEPDEQPKKSRKKKAEQE